MKRLLPVLLSSLVLAMPAELPPVPGNVEIVPRSAAGVTLDTNLVLSIKTVTNAVVYPTTVSNRWMTNEAGVRIYQVREYTWSDLPTTNWNKIQYEFSRGDGFWTVHGLTTNKNYKTLRWQETISTNVMADPWRRNYMARVMLVWDANPVIFDPDPTDPKPITNYVAQAVQGPITIDGNLTDWPDVNSDTNWLVSPRFFNRQTNSVTFELYPRSGLAPTWTGPDDHSISLQLRHDTNALYLAVKVQDDEHDQSKASPWDGDSLQIVITDASRTTKLISYNCAVLPTGAVISQLTGLGPVISAIVRYEPNLGDERYTVYELQLPDVGAVFGLGVVVNDGDTAAPGQQGWSGWAPYAVVLAGQPANAALVTLGVNDTNVAALKSSRLLQMPPDPEMEPDPEYPDFDPEPHPDFDPEP